MQWIWIPAVAILALFILVLCWLFFADYTCCPCRRRRIEEPVLPTHGGSSAYLPSSQEPFLPTHGAVRPTRIPSSPYSPSAPLSITQYYPPSAPQSYPGIPSDSPHLHLKFANLPVRQVIKVEDGIDTLDLHNMTVSEATQITNAFLARHIGQCHRVKIVTGRGVHSDRGVAKVKPVIESLLQNRNLKFSETNNGGCLNVVLP